MKFISLLLLLLSLNLPIAYAEPLKKPATAKTIRGDADKDGFISKEEFMVQQTKRLEKRFTEMDINKDGKISTPEYEAFVTKQKAKRAVSAPVSTNAPEKPKSIFSGIFD